MRRPLLRTALLAGLALGAGACRLQNEENLLRFRYWGDPEEVKVLNELLDEFKAAHKGVNIRAERKSPDDSYLDVLMQEFAAGTAPDVLFISSDHVDVLGRAGKLADLDPYLAREGAGLGEKDFFRAAVERFKVDGKLLVLPRDVAPVSCVYYNKALFDEAKLPYPKDDWTWDDLRADALKIARPQGPAGPARWGFADDWNLVEAWILAGGGGMLDDYQRPTRFSFAEPDALAGFLFRFNLLHRDHVMPYASDSQALSGGTQAMFQNGDLAMFHSGYWKTPAFRNITRFQWDMAPLPRRRGKPVRYWTGASGYAMRADVKNPQLCWDLIRFLGGERGQTKLAGIGLVQPALRGLAESKAFLDGKDPQNKRMLFRCAEAAQFNPSWPRWKEFMRAFWGPRTDAMWVKGYQGDPEAELKRLQAEAQKQFF